MNRYGQSITWGAINAPHLFTGDCLSYGLRDAVTKQEIENESADLTALVLHSRKAVLRFEAQVNSGSDNFLDLSAGAAVTVSTLSGRDGAGARGGGEVGAGTAEDGIDRGDVVPEHERRGRGECGHGGEYHDARPIGADDDFAGRENHLRHLRAGACGGDRACADAAAVTEDHGRRAESRTGRSRGRRAAATSGRSRWRCWRRGRNRR